MNDCIKYFVYYTAVPSTKRHYWVGGGDWKQQNEITYIKNYNNSYSVQKIINGKEIVYTYTTELNH